MDTPEPVQCSQCGEVMEEAVEFCPNCQAALCPNPDCLSEHSKKAHPNLPLYVVEGDGKRGMTIRRIDDPIKVSVTASQTVNLGDYNSAKVDFSLSNIPTGATEKDIEAALETGELAFKYVKTVISEKAAEVRRNVGR